METIVGGITAPKGFYATGGHAGIKKAKKDLCLVATEEKAVCAGCFTTNIVKAAPVLWDMNITASGEKIKGLVVNSGNANACTGAQGIRDNAQIAQTFGDCLGARVEEILVCSTGVIGVPLPLDRVTAGIRALRPAMANSAEGGALAAEAILTTDTFTKTAAVTITLSGKTVTLGGMAKGSGMIHPNMATMLAFVTTDAAINRPLLEKALKETVADTFNMLSVDGDTSTNDTLLALANGMAGNPLIDSENADYAVFLAALRFVNRKLAIDIAKDGEGATKLLAVSVTGAQTQDDARKMAKAVVSSNLFKAAMFGADANWGRALCAMGYSGAAFDPSAVSILFKSRENETDGWEAVLVVENGSPQAFDEARAKAILSRATIAVDIVLTEGTATATAWGCDLTYDYVKINGDYRS